MNQIETLTRDAENPEKGGKEKNHGAKRVYRGLEPKPTYLIQRRSKDYCDLKLRRKRG